MMLPALPVRAEAGNGAVTDACRYHSVGPPPHSMRAVLIDPHSSPTVFHECRATQQEVAALIRRTREACRLTQQQLATRMGSTQSEVARWETGDHQVTMRTLARIADALDVEVVVRFGSRSMS